MAAGDIINVSFYPTITTFVPAVGVEIIIIQILSDNYNGRYYLYDTTNSNAEPAQYTGAASNFGYPSVTKLGITNAIYFKSLLGTGATQGFSAIQTK